MKVSAFAGRIVIALVVINAAAGVTALIVSSGKQIGTLEGEMFLTTLAVSMAAFSVLPCSLALERGTSRFADYVAAFGIMAALLTFLLLISLIWTDNPSENLGRSTATSAFASLGLALINLLSLAQLPRSNEWVRLTAYGLTALTAAELTALTWTEDFSGYSIRILIATLIVLAAGSVLVPVLQRMSDTDEAPFSPALRFCPSCGAGLDDATEPATCPACGASFEVEFR